MNNVRLLPLVAFAALCLFTLKVAGLVFSGGYMLTGTAPASAEDSTSGAAKSAAETPAQAPERGGEAAAKGTGTQTAEDGAKAPKAAAGKSAAGTKVAPSNAELAVLESLSQRRKALEKHARELALRENLLKAAEKRVEERISQLKTIEARIRKKTEKRKKEKDEQFAGLVKMYSGMKPKHAAKIFDRLDIDVQKALARRMKPRVMSAILAAMSTPAARRLTLELVNDSKSEVDANSSLPKIQGRGPS